jgi:hypothetical protein
MLGSITTGAGGGSGGVGGGGSGVDGGGVTGCAGVLGGEVFDAAGLPPPPPPPQPNSNIIPSRHAQRRMAADHERMDAILSKT